MDKDLRVDHYPTHEEEILIYDRYGSGHITMTEEQAQHIRDRLTEELEDG